MMWDRKELKERGKYAMASNRGACILVALIMGVVSLVFNNSSSGTAGSGTTEAMNGVNGITNMDTEMALLFGAITTVALIISLIGLLLKIFIENTLKVGGYSFFIKNQSGMHPAFDCVLDGFRSGCYGNITLTMFLRDLYVSLWSLLFVIPGIIKNYEYMMVPYILAENPGMDHKTAFKISKRMMDGRRWTLSFWICLSLDGKF